MSSPHRPRGGEPGDQSQANEEEFGDYAEVLTYDIRLLEPRKGDSEDKKKEKIEAAKLIREFGPELLRLLDQSAIVRVLTGADPLDAWSARWATLLADRVPKSDEAGLATIRFRDSLKQQEIDQLRLIVQSEDHLRRLTLIRRYVTTYESSVDRHIRRLESGRLSQLQNREFLPQG